MNKRQLSSLLAGAVMLGGLSGGGCAQLSNRLSPPPGAAVAPACDRCAANGPMPPRFAPNLPPAGMAPPPGMAASPAVPASPPSAAEIQQNAYFPPASAAPSAPPSGSPGVYLQQPEPVTAAPEQPMPAETRPSTPQTPEPPPAHDERAASPALPVGIPQFAMVKANIANGQEPFADGIPWLKAHGYRTVLHVRAADPEDAALRRQFEQSGLRYLSLELSPQTLSKEIVEQFNRVVADANNLPLFVYDKDGSLAGALWYLHFRLVDQAPEEKARAEAEHLGFKQDRGEAHLQMWIAVQNLLKDFKP